MHKRCSKIQNFYVIFFFQKHSSKRSLILQPDWCQPKDSQVGDISPQNPFTLQLYKYLDPSTLLLKHLSLSKPLILPLYSNKTPSANLRSSYSIFQTIGPQEQSHSLVFKVTSANVYNLQPLRQSLPTNLPEKLYILDVVQCTIKMR